ncbi:predicted protein [Postia placenta Mad-698-R]|nr:predicted protein [Postia placenta Mad-698-R]
MPAWNVVELPLELLFIILLLLNARDLCICKRDQYELQLAGVMDEPSCLSVARTSQSGCELCNACVVFKMEWDAWTACTLGSVASWRSFEGLCWAICASAKQGPAGLGFKDRLWTSLRAPVLRIPSLSGNRDGNSRPLAASSETLLPDDYGVRSSIQSDLIAYNGSPVEDRNEIRVWSWRYSGSRVHGIGVVIC